jgi:hypothetical protein
MLREVHSPACTNVDAQLRNAFANWFNVTHQSAFQSLDSCNYHAARSRISKAIEPSSEFGKRFDLKHGLSVIDRLLHVKQYGGWFGSTIRRRPCHDAADPARFNAYQNQGKKIGRPKSPQSVFHCLPLCDEPSAGPLWCDPLRSPVTEDREPASTRPFGLAVVGFLLEHQFFPSCFD